MKTFEWFESNFDYGRDLVSSGVEGARSAGQSSLGEAPVTFGAGGCGSQRLDAGCDRELTSVR